MVFSLNLAGQEEVETPRGGGLPWRSGGGRGDLLGGGGGPGRLDGVLKGDLGNLLGGGVLGGLEVTLEGLGETLGL